MRAGLALAGAVAALAIDAGCSEPCCTYDSRPIALERGQGGELMVLASLDGAPAGRAILDTGTPVTIWNAPLGEGLPEVKRREVRLLGPAPSGAAPPTRAILRRTMTVAAPLGTVMGAEGPITPVALLGGDLLVNFSVEVGFAAPQLVIWSEQPATDAFLSAAGYAVVHAKRRGGGELESAAPREGIGPRGPYQYPSSMLLLRGCANPNLFDREQPLPARCCGNDQRALASGTDLSLLLGTGFGPLVLSRSAWERVSRAVGAPPPPLTPGPLLVPTSDTPVMAQWSTLSRLALVDREADAAVDPGPCVELGRSRRLEQVAVAQSRNADHALCALPCDQDPRTNNRAQNSAAYLELASEIPVAVIDDGDRLLQTLRAEIRPEGAELDGVLGAGALVNARVELDYRNQPARAIFSCEASLEAGVGACRSVGRCARLPEPGQTHSCFGLPAHALPRICDNPTACQ
jgi:hypothetical protein